MSIRHGALLKKITTKMSAVVTRKNETVFDKILDHFGFLKNIRRIHGLLLPSQRKKALITGLLILCYAVLDVFSLASILPLILLALDTSLIQSNPYLSFVYHLWGFKNDSSFLLAISAVLLLLFAVKNMINLLIHYCQSRFVYDVAADLSAREYQGYFARDYLSIAGTSSSLPVRDVLYIPIEFSIYVLLAAITFLSEFLVFCMILAGIAIYDLKILLLLLSILAPPLVLVFQLKKHKLGEFGKLSEGLRPLSLKHLLHGVHGYVEVKLYQKESAFIERFTEVQQRLNWNLSRIHTLGSVPARLLEIVAVAGVITILGYSLITTQSKNEIILLLSLFTAAAYRIMPSMNRMAMALINMKTYGHTMNVLQKANGAAVTGSTENAGSPRPIQFRKSLVLRNLSFAYPGTSRFALRNINLAISRGETIGFFGKSGAGKSTLMNILLRFLIEQSGQICVDGKPLQPCDTEAWRRLIGYVKQSPFLLDGSVAENIAFGESQDEVNSERLRLAIQQAGLEQVITRLPHGVETQVGEQGQRLSGGQRQRLAIARALYRKSELLIFDEATSELDGQTENEICEAIRTLSDQGKTIFIIAHRLTTLEPCDRICQMKDGEIIGTYCYRTLLQRELTRT